MEYFGIVKHRDMKVRGLVLLVAALMIYREVRLGKYVYILLAALIVLACFFDKYHIVSEAGVDIKYTLFGIPVHNIWRWDEITTLHTDRRKASPNVMLHIGKDIVTRTFVLTPSDCKAALALARKHNSSIYIEDLSAGQQEKREREIRERARRPKRR